MKANDSRQLRRGSALVLVMAQISLLIIFWSMANRQTGHLLKTSNALSRRSQRDLGSLSALAVGVQLLETGVPPHSPFVGSTTSGGHDYIITFTRTAEGVWIVESAPASPSDQAATLPGTFEMAN